MSNGDDDKQPMSQIQVREIQKQAVSHFAKITIAAFFAFIGVAGLGLWFYAEKLIEDYLKSKGVVPVGAVIALDDPNGCATLGPAWSDAGFAGRFVVGADPNDRDFSYRSARGSKSAALDARHMPQVYVRVISINSGGGNGLPGIESIGFVPITGNVIVGGNEKPTPLDTMPPYVALHFCKRVK
ncbi:MAG: hypothetical protein AB1490_02895 [Pseudomonadota bacterium]